MKDGFTGYTPTPGLWEAREAITRYVERYKHVKSAPEEVVIVPGGKPTMFYAMLALVNPGDEVICPNPGFPIYESCVRFAGGIPVPMPLLEENDFRVDLQKLQKSITEKTKLLILNSPGNPTGGVLTREDIASIADMVRGKGIYVLSDEIYDRIVYDGEAISIATMPGMKDYTIILDGFSKTYDMTGWRLGYGVMNPDLAEKFTLLMVNSNSCAAAFSQIAGIEALEGPQDSVDEMVSAFRSRRDYMVQAIRTLDGVHCAVPKGAFYVFMNIRDTGLSSQEFADRLLIEGGVASLSGRSFGEYGEGFVRLSCANSLENLQKAVDRIGKFLQML